MLKTFTSGSWKTTSAGILSVATGVYLVVNAVKAKAFDQNVMISSLTAILAGIGLIFARDNNKTSTDVGIDTSPTAQAQRDAKKVS